MLVAEGLSPNSTIDSFSVAGDIPEESMSRSYGLSLDNMEDKSNLQVGLPNISLSSKNAKCSLLFFMELPSRPIDSFRAKSIIETFSCSLKNKN